MKNHLIRLTALSVCMVAGIAVPASAAERTIRITDDYLVIPVSHKFDRARLVFRIPGMEDMPADIRIPRDGKPEYYTFRDMSAFRGKKITITYPDGLEGIDGIYQSDSIPGGEMIYKEKNRPQLHFTTRRGWINDPNGLIYHDGEYHLFYQHNPYERDWGNMHWGHAVSTDLVHWTELPDALYPDMSGTMFSGSAVIDYGNTSGFGKKDRPAMVVAYTVDSPEKQSQAIAYSLDKGRTFHKYEGNPVVDSHKMWNTHDTRDPKVFPYDGHWVMVLNERDGNSIYTSGNLRDWTYKSHTTGFWECPELFPLPVDGDPGKMMWVMYGASGTYMLGDFDGEKFTPRSGKYRFTGGSIYAAQTINNIPGSDGRRIQIGWGRIGHPGEIFNGQMLLPTELKLRTTKDGVRLTNMPVSEIESLSVPAGSWSDLTQDEANRILAPFAGSDRLRIRVRLRLSHATDAFMYLNGRRIVDYDMNQTTLNGYHYSPEDPASMELTADIYIDRTSTEVFVDNGMFSYSQDRNMDNEPGSIGFGGNRIMIESLEVFDLPSIWE